MDNNNRKLYNTRKSQPRQVNKLKKFLSQWFEFCPNCGARLRFIGYTDKMYRCKVCDVPKWQEEIKETLR